MTASDINPQLGLGLNLPAEPPLLGPLLGILAAIREIWRKEEK